MRRGVCSPRSPSRPGITVSHSANALDVFRCPKRELICLEGNVNRDEKDPWEPHCSVASFFLCSRVLPDSVAGVYLVLVFLAALALHLYWPRQHQFAGLLLAEGACGVVLLSIAALSLRGKSASKILRLEADADIRNYANFILVISIFFIGIVMLTAGIPCHRSRRCLGGEQMFGIRAAYFASYWLSLLLTAGPISLALRLYWERFRTGRERAGGS